MEHLGFVYAIGAAILWGLAYAIDQKLLMTVSPLTLLFTGSVLSAILLFPFLFLEKNPFRELTASGPANLSLLVFSVCVMTLANLFIFSGIKNLDAATASMIEIAYPFFVVLFSFFLFRTVPNLYFFAGGMLIFLGSAIIIRFG